MDTPVRKRIGDILIERGKLDAATLERALRLQQESGERLGALLVTLGVVAQRDVAEALAAQLELPLVDAGSYPDDDLQAMLDKDGKWQFLHKNGTSY